MSSRSTRWAISWARSEIRTTTSTVSKERRRAGCCLIPPQSSDTARPMAGNTNPHGLPASALRGEARDALSDAGARYPRADRAASSRRAGRAFRATPAPHSTPRQFGASANDARRIRHHDLAAQLERMIDRLRRFRRCALGLAPPAERTLARRARDHPGTPGAGGIVTETREVKQLERIVSRRLTGLRP